MRERRREFLLLIVFVLGAGMLVAQQGPTLRISGKNIQTLQITAAQLAKMPRLSVDVRNPHTDKAEHYDGVRLSDLLAKADVPLGEKLRGRALATYVVAQGSDGYAAVYSIAEIDPAMNDNRIVLADKIDGKPLGEHEGPFRIIAPNDKRPARWVRMVNAIQVEIAISPSESSPR